MNYMEKIIRDKIKRIDKMFQLFKTKEKTNDNNGSFICPHCGKIIEVKDR